MKQKGKTWIDANGKEIPTYAISKVLQVEEQWAQKLVDAALKAEKALKSFVVSTHQAYKELVELKQLEAKMKGNKGNRDAMTINSFDQLYEINITKPSSVTFDKTTMSLIQSKITEYLDGLSATNEMALFLKGLLEDLLHKKGGAIDQSKLSTVRKRVAEIKDKPELAKKAQSLIEAVDLFDKGSRAKNGNTGIYVKVRDNFEEKKRDVVLKYTDV